MVWGEQDHDPWYGRLLALVHYTHTDDTVHRLALLHYLVEKDPPGQPLVVDAKHFQYYGRQPQFVDIQSIIKPCNLVTARFPVAGNYYTLALPYGKSFASTNVNWAVQDDE